MKLANEYLSENENEKNCPLCGANYINNEELLSKIYALTKQVVNDTNIDILQKDKYVLEKLISQLTEKIKANKNKQGWQIQLMLAFDDIKYPDIFDVSQYQTAVQILEYVKSIMKQGEKLQEEEDKLNSRLETLEEMGFSEENINKLKEFTRTNKLYNNFKINDGNIGIFENYVVSKKNIIELDNVGIIEEIATRQDALDVIRVSLSGINIIQVNGELTEFVKELNMLDYALTGFSELSRHFDMHKYI